MSTVWFVLSFMRSLVSVKMSYNRALCNKSIKITILILVIDFHLVGGSSGFRKECLQFCYKPQWRQTKGRSGESHLIMSEFILASKSYNTDKSLCLVMDLAVQGIKITHQLLDGLPRTVVQAFMVSRGWILTTLQILFLQICSHKPMTVPLVYFELCVIVCILTKSH